MPAAPCSSCTTETDSFISGTPRVLAKRNMDGNSKKRSRAEAKTKTPPNSSAPNAATSTAPKDEYDIEKPKRFLTAYNFFFMNERAAFLKSQEPEGASTTEDDPDASKPWTKKTKRSHKKTHGKIDFSSLSRRVSSKWKALTPAEKSVYEDMASDDLARYRHELRIYKKKVAAEKKRAQALALQQQQASGATPALPGPDPAKIEADCSYSSSSTMKKTPALPEAGSLNAAEKMKSSVKEKKAEVSLGGHKDNLSSPSKEEKLAPSFSFFKTTKLYGRDKHISTIMDAYSQIGKFKRSSQVVTVSGYSGAGKSALVQQAQKPIADMGGNFVSGKFDHFRQMEPLSAIIFAFTDFCNRIAAAETEKLNQTRAAIQEKVGSEIDFLAVVIPSLRRIIPNISTEMISVGAMEAQNRLKYVFQLFVRAIASPSQPLVLFLDDLQWADPFSLDIIEILISDTENESFLFIGSYRDNEVTEQHPLAIKLRNIEERQINITKIKVDNLNKEDTNELISDLIQTPPHFTQSLSHTVYRKTSGNVFFILQFLRSICDEGLLTFSSKSKNWEWDTTTIESKKIADNTVEIMLHKILQLPKQTQSALKLMACLGCCTEDFILCSIAAGDSIGNFGCTDLFASLELAGKEGLVNHVGSKYNFAHDQIQLATYSLIPEAERGNWHLWIGSQVWANKSASPEKALFVVVGQLNRGAEVMTTPQQRIQLAGLNLQAAKRSKALAAFVPAEFYLKTGIKLLGRDSWVDEYGLCLELFNSCAEAEYCTGNFAEMNRMLDTVFANAQSLDDKIDAYFTLVRALFAQANGLQASKVGLLVLSQLGESFPTFSDIKSIIVVEFAKVKQIIGGMTDDELMTIRAMDDGHKIAAMRLMLLLAHTSFLSNQEIFALIILRMVQTTVNHGLCDESAFAFASLGCLMSGLFNDINGAYRFGQISLRLLERSQLNVCIPPVYVAVYTFIHPWVDHYRSCLGPLQHAYDVGMRCGDINYAVTAATNCFTISLVCGEELTTVEKMLRKCIHEMVEHKQEIYWKYSLPFWQAVVNLLGHSDNTQPLIGQELDQEQVLRDALDNKRMRAVVLSLHIQSWLAYIFGNYESAAAMTERKQSIALLPSPHFLSCNYLFVDGLVSFEMARKTGESKWMVLAQKSLEGMQKLSLHPPVNSQHKVLLLQAESCFLVGDIPNANENYEHAIRTAGENGFVQDQALAYERAGIFHSQQGNTSTASRYYGQAHNAYLKWGAKRKADHLCQNIVF